MQLRKLLQSQPSTSDLYLPPQTPPHHHHNHHLLLIPLLAATATVFLLFLFTFLYHRRTRKRTAPYSFTFNNPPHRFSYSLLRRATHSFSFPLGHGGFGTVYSGTFPSPSSKSNAVKSIAVKFIAVKLMDSTSHQGEREFHNELFFSSKLRSVHVIAPIGFCSDPKRRRFLLVYPLMQNGNLQDALLRRKCPELFNWKKRFEIALDIAKGLCYLHSCDPPVIHGDIKPSNILLNSDFTAKIGDFGLARLKSEPLRAEVEVLVDDSDYGDKKNVEEEECDGISGVVVDDCGSMESQSVNTSILEEGFRVEQSPVSPETVEMGMMMTVEMSPGSVKSEKDAVVGVGVGVGGVKRNGKGLKSNSVKDLWWKQDNENAGLGSGSMPVVEGKKVKDYVMEWIGKEVKSEMPNSEELEGGKMGKPERKKGKKKKLEWWESMDEENVSGFMRNEKRKPVREWWNEEYCEEIARRKKNKKKNKKKNGVESDNNGNSDHWWVSDDELHGDRKKNKRDWWLDGFSGELWRARRNSFDSASAEIPKSGGVSSTPSMRGTVCYVAPEYGFGEDVSEKCDVYSFGILLLVIISGRRPLQVTGSPLSEFQRANLLSWARHCARNGKLIELVDESIQSLDKDQALLCIKVALICLLKSPARRPSMKEVVGMLNGDLEPPQLPVEYSPSTPSRFPFKSRRKGK